MMKTTGISSALMSSALLLGLAVPAPASPPSVTAHVEAIAQLDGHTDGSVPAPDADTTALVAADPTAQAYYSALLRHTRWAETQFDQRAGIYRSTDLNFAVVLGNAVLLTRGDYDAAVAGVEKDVLHRHTIATIEHYAASNRLVGGTQWGRKLFWDTTFQSYFILSAHLLWDDLSDATKANVRQIASEQSEYAASLGSRQDPASGGWTTNGLAGGYRGDTKLEEMGVYAQALAPGMAWSADDGRSAGWASAFGIWSRNEAGLPAADLANPALVDGVPVSENRAHNIHGSFAAENHDSFGPHYQEELWRTSGRNAIHFVLAGTPLPEVLTAQPNGEELWSTILEVMSDSGEPLMPMVDDREHLYGRDAIPLAFLSQVKGDRYAAAAEAALAERLEAYQAYPPVNRLTKFSGEPKYEPEARAEIAISYLLHEWRASTGDPVEPASAKELFDYASGTTDHGTDLGLLSHQAPTAWAGSVSKKGFTKFAWQPAHDNWFFDIGGKSPVFLPSTSQAVQNRFAKSYSELRDGFAGTASLFRTDGGFAGMTTLPTGSVVYATSGTADGEGRLKVQNLTMPGIAGLDGNRTYSFAEGTETFKATDPGSATGAPAGIARLDELVFPVTTARHVRMQGVQGHPVYGYSLFELEARNGAATPNLARGKTASASSADPARPVSTLTDGSLTTRWAVSREDRARADSWAAIDLGQPMELDRVSLFWEASAGAGYRIQTSLDGQTWTDVADYGLTEVSSSGGWLSIDNKAGLVVRNSDNPLTVRGDQVILSDGPAAGSAGMVVEGYADVDADSTAKLSARPAPVASHSGLAVSDTEGYLSLFNLSAADIAATVQVPRRDDGVHLYRGEQITTEAGTTYNVSLDPATSRLEPTRFIMKQRHGNPVPSGVVAVVENAQTVSITAPATGKPLQLTITQSDTGEERQVTVPAGRTKTVALESGGAYPIADIALDRTTFPTSPLPLGMSDPGFAVDADPETAWTPGPLANRMVIDLGSEQVIGKVKLGWAAGNAPGTVIQVSSDGRAYRDAAVAALDDAGTSSAAVNAAGRYLAIVLPEGSGQVQLHTVEVMAGE